jgi:hypothetical protein
MSKALKHKWLQAYQQEKEREHTEHGSKPAPATEAHKGTSGVAAGEACPSTLDAVSCSGIIHFVGNIFTS